MFIDFLSAFVDNPNLQILQLNDQLYIHQTFAFKKGSEFEELFSHQIKVMEESGILNTLRKAWFPENGKTASNIQGFDASANVLGFENLVFPFMILAAGSSIAIVSSIFEWLSNKPRMKHVMK